MKEILIFIVVVAIGFMLLPLYAGIYTAAFMLSMIVFIGLLIITWIKYRR